MSWSSLNLSDIITINIAITMCKSMSYSLFVKTGRSQTVVVITCDEFCVWYMLPRHPFWSLTVPKDMAMRITYSLRFIHKYFKVPQGLFSGSFLIISEIFSQALHKLFSIHSQMFSKIMWKKNKFFSNYFKFTLIFSQEECQTKSQFFSN